MRHTMRTCIALMLTLHVTGCSVLSESGLTAAKLVNSVTNKASIAPASKSNTQVANPPARTLRFDGHEIVLGESENPSLETDRLIDLLQPLVDQQRMQSAAMLILRHRESSERLLAERWATAGQDPVLDLVAEVLSQRCTRTDSNWKSLLRYAKAHGNIATRYQQLRNDFAAELRTSDPSDDTAQQLQTASQNVHHPLARIDALRLLGLRELVAGREAWAESLFRQAIELANDSGHTLVAAELWLTVSETARRSQQLSTAASAWQNAVGQHLSAAKKMLPVDVSFWLLADQTRPETLPWPEELSSVLGDYVEAVGCSRSGRSEMALWTSVAQAQLDRNELQSALVNFKKAETLASGEDALWLRIAQARCLAGMGQAPAAAAILSGPAASSDASLSAAATAAMGAIKLQSGAYQQGAQLLHKALTQTPTAQWPLRNQSLADLAMAQLIIGDTDAGLTALHEAQRLLEKAGERQPLIQSLENEARLLEHEHRQSQVSNIQARIAQLEQL